MVWQPKRTARRFDADRGGLQSSLNETTMNSTAQKAAAAEAPQSRMTSGPAIVLYIAAAKLLLHLLMVARYGIFRDEMYYLACSRHMAWGYVDHPPLTVWVAWFSRVVLGD